MAIIIEDLQNNMLKQKREGFGLRQQDVATALGLEPSDARISLWEHGTSAPSLTNLLKLCALYNTTVQDIYPYLYEDIHQDLTKRIEKLTTFRERNVRIMG
jgi:transcriptional regulator with XRE-family HTH domain